METSHTLLALSIRQPWADQVLTGEKPEEYRSQPTHVRGRIYIYASLGFDEPEARTMPRGVIVGEVTLYGCRDNGQDYAWLLKDPVRWPEPKAPTQRANPVWFRPWGEPADAPAPGNDPPDAGGGVGHPVSNGADARVSRTRTPDDLWENSDPMSVVRRYFAEVGSLDRASAIGGLAHEVGYGRTGPLIAERIDNSLRTAVRRGILRNEAGMLALAAHSLEGVERALLKDQFLASIGRQWVDRDEAIRDFARWMGFRRTGSSIDETCRSLINGLLREGRLTADGPRVRRA